MKHVGDTHYQDRVIRLHELISDGPPVIKGFTFERCEIVGPAMVYLRGNGAMSNCTFGGNPDITFVQLAPEQNEVMGAFVLEDCRFDDCRFTAIGFLDKDRELRTRFEGS